MTRTIAPCTWGHFKWGEGTWVTPSTSLTDLVDVIDEDPDDVAEWGTARWGHFKWGTKPGGAIGHDAIGAGRFVVMVLDPTLAGDAPWGHVQWGHFKWSSSVGKWRDISARVRGVQWEQGAQSAGELSDIGTSTVRLANTDGEASSWASTGEFMSVGGGSYLRAGLIMRFGVITPTTGDVADVLASLGITLETFEPFFTGRVDTLQEGTSDNADAWVDVTLVETTADLGTTAKTPYVLNDGAGLAAGIWRALVAAGYPYQTSMVRPDDDVTTYAAPFGGDDGSGGGQTWRDIVQALADNRFWDVLADGRGKLTVVARRSDLLDSGLVFSNDPTGNELPFDGDGVAPYSGVERVLNDVTASTNVGSPVTVIDASSVKQFGDVSQGFGFPRNDLVLDSDDDVTYLLGYVVDRTAWDDFGLDSIPLDADMDAERMPAALTFLAAHAREGYTLRVRWVHPSGAVFTESVVVEGQSHDIAPVGTALKWTATLRLAHAGIVSGT